MKHVVLLAFFLLFNPGSVFPDTYYVAKHGDDKNPGWVHVSFSKDSKKNKRANTLRAVRKSLKTHYIPFKNENTA